MFTCNIYHVLFCFIVTFIQKSCTSELPPPPPALMLYSPGEPEFTDVVVRRVSDNLTLVCEVRGDATPRTYVWNYVGQNMSGEHSPLPSEPQGLTNSSTLFISELTISDSGHYMCSAPPFSLTKYILVQNRGDKCGRGALSCGAVCVPALYICDGRNDCPRGEDEANTLCAHAPCTRSDKLNCSSGRCISEAMCCRVSNAALCRQPTCCEEHHRYNAIQGYMDMEYPALFEDRHAPDDYGFIQSTIYTVTACALIFMIAVVLLVSAICKMHMKRAALRDYTRADHTRAMHYAQTHRFPPCYETSRLLEQARNNDVHITPTAQVPSPTVDSGTDDVEATDGCTDNANTYSLTRLTSIFNTRYRQVPTQPDVEMTAVRPSSLTSSPAGNRPRTRLEHYRSPTFDCDLNRDYMDPDISSYGRDLNYMAAPCEFFRRRGLRSPGSSVLQQAQARPLTLQLGRFQLSIPRFGRRESSERRPDTPNIAEINIEDLDFVRLNSGETYTLNGRTIRLLGGNFENYPVLPDSSNLNNPPAYNDAMRYKLYGPPPEYLSTDVLNDGNVNIDEQARSNIELPPLYDELNARVNNNDENNTVNNASNVINSNDITDNAVNNDTTVINSDITVSDNNNATTDTVFNDTSNNNNEIVIETIDSVIDNLPAIDSDVNANDAVEC